MDFRILEFGFFMTAVTEIGHIPYEFYTVFLLRMLLVLRCDVAGITSYAQSTVVIF
jgi:hypothetical protein